MDSHGTAKATDMFRMVNTKVRCNISVQSWSGAMIAGRAMEKLDEPMLIVPKLPSPTKEYEDYEDREVPNLGNQGGKITPEIIVKKT